MIKAAVDEMTAGIKQLARDLDIQVIDINAATASHPEHFSFDGIHANVGGAKHIAETVYTALELTERSLHPQKNGGFSHQELDRLKLAISFAVVRRCTAREIRAKVWQISTSGGGRALGSQHLMNGWKSSTAMRTGDCMLQCWGETRIRRDSDSRCRM
jgi:hypothetical protein